MSLVDDLKSGYKAGSWNKAPFYPSAVWTSKIKLTGTSSIAGLTFEAYARTGEFATVRLFDINITEDVDGSDVVLFLKAAETSTALAMGCHQVFVTCQFTEDVTGETYTYFQGFIPVDSGIL